MLLFRAVVRDRFRVGAATAFSGSIGLAIAGLLCFTSPAGAGMVEVEPHIFCSLDANGARTFCLNLTPPPVRIMGETSEQPTETLPSASAPAASAPAVSKPPPPAVTSTPETETKTETKTETTAETPKEETAPESSDESSASKSSSAPAEEPSHPASAESHSDDDARRREREAERRLIHQKSKEALDQSRDRLRSRPGYSDVEPITGPAENATQTPSGPDYNAINNTAAAVGAIIGGAGDGLKPPQDEPVCIAGDVAAALQRDLDKERDEIDKKLKELEDELRKERDEAEKEKKKLEKDKELDKKIKGRKQAKKERKDLSDKRKKLNDKRDKLVEENDGLEADKEKIEKDGKKLREDMQKARRNDPNCRSAACRKIRGQLEDNSRQRVENIKDTGKFQQKWERHRREQRNLARDEAKFEAKLDRGFGQSKEQWKARNARKQATAFQDEMWRLKNRQEVLNTKKTAGTLSRSEAKELNNVNRQFKGLENKYGDATRGDSKFHERARKFEAKLEAESVSSIDEAARLDANKINARYNALDEAVKNVEQARESLRNPQNKPDSQKAEKAVQDHKKAEKDVERYRKEYDAAVKKQPIKHPPVKSGDIEKARKKWADLTENGGSYREVQDAAKEYDNLKNAEERHWREQSRIHQKAQEQVGEKLDAAYQREETLRPLANAGRAQKFVGEYNREINEITGSDGKVDVAKVDAKARKVDRDLAGVSGANAEIAKLNGVRKNLAPGKGGAPSAAEQMGLGKDAVKARLGKIDKQIASASSKRDRYSASLNKAGFKNAVNASGQCVVESATSPFAWAYVQGTREAAKRQTQASSAPKKASAGKGTASPAAGQIAKNTSNTQQAKQATQAKQAQQYKAPSCSPGGGVKTSCTKPLNASKLAQLDKAVHNAPGKKPGTQLASAPANFEAVPSALAGFIGGPAAALLRQASVSDRLRNLWDVTNYLDETAKKAASAARQAHREADKADEIAARARQDATEARQQADKEKVRSKPLVDGYDEFALAADKRAAAQRAKAKAERAAAARSRAAAATYERTAERSKADKKLASQARQAAANNTEDAKAHENRAKEFEREAAAEDANASGRRAKKAAVASEAREFERRAKAAEAKAVELEAAAASKRAEAKKLDAAAEKRAANLKEATKQLETTQSKQFTDLLKNPPSDDFYSGLPSAKRAAWLRKNVAGWDRLTVEQKTRVLAAIEYAEARKAAIDAGAALDRFTANRTISPETLEQRQKHIVKLQKEYKALKDETFLSKDDIARTEELEKQIGEESKSLKADITEFLRLRKIVMAANLEAQRRLWAADPDSREDEVEVRVASFATALGHLKFGEEAAKAREKAFATRRGILDRKLQALKKSGTKEAIETVERQLQRLEDARKEWSKFDAVNISALQKIVKGMRWDIASQGISDKLFEITDEDELQKRAQAYLEKNGDIANKLTKQSALINKAVRTIDLKDPNFSASKAVLKFFDGQSTDWAVRIGSTYGLIKGAVKGLAGFLKLFIWEPIDMYGEDFERRMQAGFGFRTNFFGTDNQDFLKAFGEDPGKMSKALFFGLGKQIHDFVQNTKRLGKAVQDSDAESAFTSSTASAEFIGEFFIDPTILLGGVSKVVTVLRAGGKGAAALKAADKVLSAAPAARAVEEVAVAAAKRLDNPPPLPDALKAGRLPEMPTPPTVPAKAVPNNGNANPAPAAPKSARGPPVGGKCGVQFQLFAENCGLVAVEALLKDLGIVAAERVQSFMWHFAYGKGLLAPGKGMTVYQIAEYLRLTGINPNRMVAGFHNIDEMARALQKGRDIIVNTQNGAGGYHWVRVEKIGKNAKGEWWVSFGEGGLPKGFSKRITLQEFERITRVYPSASGAGRRLRSLVVDSAALTPAEKVAARTLAADNLGAGKRAVQPVPNNPVQQAPLPKNPVGAPPGAPRPLPDISSTPGNLVPPAKRRPTIEYPKAKPTIEYPKAKPTIEYPKSAAKKPQPEIVPPKSPAPAAGGNAPKSGPAHAGSGGKPRLNNANQPPRVTVDQAPFDITITLPGGKQIVLEIGDTIGKGSFTVVNRLLNMQGVVVKVTKGGVEKAAVILDDVGYKFLDSLPKGVKRFIVRTPKVMREYKIAAANDNALVNGSIRIAQEAPPTFWDLTQGTRGMTAREAEMFRKSQRTINDGGYVWLDNKANNFGFELTRDGRLRLVIHDTGGIVPMLGEGKLAVLRAKAFQRAVSSPPAAWLKRYEQAAQAVAENLAAWRRANAMPEGTPGREAFMNQAEKAYRNALAAKTDIPFHYRESLLKTFGSWIDTGRLGVPLKDIAFNPVNGFEYPKPRFLIANDNTPASLQKALKTVEGAGGKT